MPKRGLGECKYELGGTLFWEDHSTARMTMTKYHIFSHTTQCGNNLGKNSEIIYEFISSTLTKNYTQKKDSIFL